MPEFPDLRQVSTRQKMGRTRGEELLRELQLQLVSCQQTVYMHGQRVVLVFEGADASGKGGIITRLTSKMDPRGYRVYATGPPTSDELSRHYLQRFWPCFPGRGELAIFDRSWYGRVLVERVDQLTPEDRWRQAYAEINELERGLVDDGVVLLKFFLHLSKEEQKRRLMERMRKPHKRWKITDADLDAYEKFSAYTDAWNEMLALTHSEYSPWLVIPADNKYAARVAVLQGLIAKLTATAPRYTQQLAPELLARARLLFAEEVPD